MARQKPPKRTAPSKRVQTPAAQPAPEVPLVDGPDGPKKDVTLLESILAISKAIIVLLTLPLVSVCIQLSLHPLYAAFPTISSYKNVTLAAVFLTGFLPEPRVENILTGALGVAFIAAPKLYFLVGAATGRFTGDPWWGPLATHVLLTVPLYAMCVSLLKFYLSNGLSRPPPFILAAPLLGWNFVQGIEPLYWEKLSLGDPINATTLFTSLGTFYTLLAALTPIKSPKTGENTYKHAYAAIVGLVAIGIGVIVPLQSRTFPIVSSDGTHRLLASATGPLGLVTVGENLVDQFRYLRAGHSLIGGLWINNKGLPVTSANPKSLLQPTELGDSVYSAFLLQEGVRLFQRNKADNKGEREEVLIIGLGAGIIPRAMHDHNFNITLIEIDPIVYKFAKEYFGLHRLALEPPNNTDGEVYLQDARHWVHGNSNSGRKYDYIIHDVFSGGSVPTHLFTVEFWNALKSMIKEDGVLGVNFAGKIGTPSSRAVWKTLLHVFKGCRAFHDDMEVGDGVGHHGDDDFMNLVFFCSPSLSTLLLRPAMESDFLNSPLREHILSTMAQREVSPDRIIGKEEGEAEWVIRDGMNNLAEWQKASAMDHWKVIRNVLPASIWESY